MNNYGKKCKIFTHSNDAMNFIDKAFPSNLKGDDFVGFTWRARNAQSTNRRFVRRVYFALRGTS